MKLSWFCLFLLAAACARSLDPCPKGMVLDGDHCVDKNPLVAAQQDPKTDADKLPDPPPKADRLDAAAQVDLEEAGDPTNTETGSVAPDAGLDAQTSDAGISSDSMVLPTDAHSPEPETGVDPFDAQVDAKANGGDDADANEPVDATTTDAQLPNACSDTDLATWRTFQISGQLIPTIASCYANDPECRMGACDLDGCLRAAIGVTSCVACIAEETRCAVGACSAECASSTGSDACRACACREGCIGASSGCGMGPVDICADCHDGTCTNISLDPALIMVIINSALDF